MYRFDEIKSLAMMKNVCLYIRIYNEIESSTSEILDIVVRDYIREKYNKDIPLFDLVKFKGLAKSFTKEGNIPSLLQLDEIIAVYIKTVDKKAKELYKSIQDLEFEYENNKHMTKDGFTYTSKELSILERPANKRYKSHVLAIILGAILFAVAVVVMSYPILSNYDIDLTNWLYKNKDVALYLPLFSASLFVGVIILWLVLRKNMQRLTNLFVLIAVKLPSIKRLEAKLESTRAQFDRLIQTNKVISVKDGNVIGLDKLNYLLRIDNDFVGDFEEEKKTEAQNSEVKKETSNDLELNNFKQIEVVGWESLSSANEEKRNCNLDLVGRVGLITDSIKANGESDSKEFNEVIQLYVGDLSSENRENNIVKEKSQIKMYEFYLTMVNKLEPYEKLCKNKYGLDYDSERYSYRVASTEEKDTILSYILSIIESQFKSNYFSDKFKDKVYNKYSDIKNIDMVKINKRSELYKLYIDFVKDFKKRIHDYIK